MDRQAAKHFFNAGKDFANALCCASQYAYDFDKVWDSWEKDHKSGWMDTHTFLGEAAKRGAILALTSLKKLYVDMGVDAKLDKAIMELERGRYSY